MKKTFTAFAMSVAMAASAAVVPMTPLPMFTNAVSNLTAEIQISTVYAPGSSESVVGYFLGSNSNKVFAATNSSESVKSQSDWAETNPVSASYIKNKPTNVSAFANDVGYATTNELEQSTKLHPIDFTQWKVEIDSPEPMYYGEVVYSNTWGIGIHHSEELEDTVYSEVADLEATEFSVSYNGVRITATRSAIGGYYIGSQTNNVVASTNTATSAHNGLMSTGDKQRLDGLNATIIPMSDSDATTISAKFNDVVPWVGTDSIQLGEGIAAGSSGSFAGGKKSRAGEVFMGMFMPQYTPYNYSFVWSGMDGTRNPITGPAIEYWSHGDGTFNVNPTNGASGFYIGETNLNDLIDSKLGSIEGYATTSYVDTAVAPLASTNYVVDVVTNHKPTRIYNESGTDALDDKGQLFKSAVETGGRFEAHIVDNLLHTEKDIVCPLLTINGTSYYYRDINQTTGWDFRINGGAGSVEYSQFELSPSIPKNTNPTNQQQSEAIAGTYTGSSERFVVTATYIPQASVIESNPYAHLAVESVPTRTIAASTAYAVGDLLGDSGKAYRCKLAYTSAATPTAPSSDTTHWDEIPVLSQKADAADLPYSLTTKTVVSAAVTLDDRAIQAVTLEDASTTVTLPTPASGKVADLILEVTNAYAPSDTPAQAEIALAGTLGQDYNVVVQEGTTLQDMMTFAPGEIAEVSITLTAFNVGGLPTWKIVKQVMSVAEPAEESES